MVQRRHDQMKAIRTSECYINTHSLVGIGVLERGITKARTGVPGAIRKVLEGTDRKSCLGGGVEIAIVLAATDKLDAISFEELTFRGVVNDYTDRLAYLECALAEAATCS